MLSVTPRGYQVIGLPSTPRAAARRRPSHTLNGLNITREAAHKLRHQGQKSTPSELDGAQKMQKVLERLRLQGAWQEVQEIAHQSSRGDFSPRRLQGALHLCDAIEHQAEQQKAALDPSGLKSLIARLTIQKNLLEHTLSQCKPPVLIPADTTERLRVFKDQMDASMAECLGSLRSNKLETARDQSLALRNEIKRILSQEFASILAAHGEPDSGLGTIQEFSRKYRLESTRYPGELSGFIGLFMDGYNKAKECQTVAERKIRDESTWSYVYRHYLCGAL